MNKPSPKHYTSKWTVMVYFAADNDLDDVAFENLRQMKQAGSNSQLNILAQLDTRGIGKTVRFRVRDQRTTLEEDTLEIMGEVNTGLSSELTDFVDWGMKKFPAKHYMLIIWGHGQGWQSANDAHRAAARTTDAVQRVGDASLGISLEGELRVFPQRQERGDRTAPSQVSINPEIMAAITALLESDGGRSEGHSRFAARLEHLGVKLNKDRKPPTDSQDVLTDKELKKALKVALKRNPGGRLDILGMDACLMGMAETAYEVRESVDYFVASEDAVPRNSWPYDRILARLADEPGMEPNEVALMMIREYLIHYRDNPKGVTLSACRLNDNTHGALKNALKGLAGTLMKKIEDEKTRLAIMTARAVVQSFYLKEFIDLYDFCKQLDRFSTDADVKRKCKAVMRAIFPTDGQKDNSFSDGTFVWTYGYCGYPVKDARGVSIYFPIDRLPRDEYKELEFTTQTGWGEFIESFVNKLGLPADSLAFAPGDLNGPLAGSPVKDEGGRFMGHSNLKVASGSDEKVASGSDEKIPLGSLAELPGEEQNSPQFEYEQEKAAKKRA